MTIRDLHLRLRALVLPRRVERELADELAFHVDREAADLVARGAAPDEARRIARARFGSVTAVADGCRDARGTRAVGTLGRDLRYAWRTWSRAPLAAATIVLTVALGLGLMTIAFTIYNALFLRTDAVSNPEELYEVYRPPQAGADVPVPFTRDEYETFRSGNTIFSDVAAVQRDFELRVDGRSASAMFVSGGFFHMLGISAAQGRALTPADDRPGALPLIVLSDAGWATLFVRDPTVIGRTVRVNGVPVEIVGVMPEGFRGLAIGTPDFWAPLASTVSYRSQGAEPPVEIIGRLRAGVTREEAATAVRQWAAGPGFKAVDGRPLIVTVRPRTGVSPDTWFGMMVFGVPLFFVFGIILLIACANVASLLLARGVARQQEIGVRLSLGASRRRLVGHLLTEGLMLGAAAAVLAYPISRMLATGTMAIVQAVIPPEFAEQVNLRIPDADWRVVPFLVLGAVTATAMFGLMPALQATRLDPVRTMRGEVLQDARPGRARRTLMVLQVGTSTLLLICAAIFLRGVFLAADADPGVRVTDTLRVAIGSESRRTAVLEALAADPLVTMTGAASDLDEGTIPIRAVETGIVASQAYQFVSHNYFDLLDVAIVRGRTFMPSDTVDAGAVIVSTRTARALWPDRDPIGRTVRLAVPSLDDPPPSGAAARTDERTFTVIGVSRDVRRDRGFVPGGAGLYLPASVMTPGTRLLVRVNEDPLRARTRLIDSLTRVDPALASVRTLRSIFRGLETILRVAFLVAMVLGGLALLLTISGLFSVLSYLVQQRTKEIGVRMALGASARAVARLVLLESARPVLVGAAAGALLAAAAAGGLMATPAAGAIGEMVNVLDPVAYVGTLLVIIGACAVAASAPALRAARVDPMVTLRQD